MAKTIVGVDIGSNALRAVELADAGKPRPTLMRYHEVPLPEGAVNRGEVLEPNTVADALKRLWKTAGFATKDVVLGIGNQRVFARDLVVPKEPLSRIRESLSFQVQDMLPVPVGDAILDFYPISEEVGEHGPVVHGLLIAAVKEAVENNVAAVQRAGLNVVDVDLIPFALNRLLVRRHAADGGAVLVDIGANTTNVVMTIGGVPQFIRIIPSGGDDVTQALRGALQIETGEAENLKRSLGLAAAVADSAEQHAVEVIYRVTGELLTSLRNTISYFMNTHPNDEFHRIVLTGGGSKMTGFREALAQMTRLSVVEADPYAGVVLGRKLQLDELRAQGNLSVALGLAWGNAA